MISISRLCFHAAACLGLAASRFAAAAVPATHFLLEEMSIVELQQHMSSGETSAHAIVQHYLDRIGALDKTGPSINALIELNPDALSLADALDVERHNGHVRGPLHGIPVVLKDNIDTADHMHTSAGSLALADLIAARDSTVAAKLRAAGAIVLGKTNLSEWANFRSAYASSGWSGRGGQTRNPYVLNRNPCGSSSGTAAAVSANFAAAGIGTETDGSIVCPSSVNGLVGIKPTLGLVSRAGIVPIAHSQDTAGPMARSVSDAVILLNAIAGADVRDAVSTAATAHATDYTRFLTTGGLAGTRIGVVRKLAGFNPDVDALLAQNIATLKAAGATVIDPVELPHTGKYDEDEMIVLQYEFKHDLNAYLAALPSSSNVPRSLSELIAFNTRERVREMPWFGQDLFEQSQARGELTDKAYVAARGKAKAWAGIGGIDASLKKYRLDALIAPTSGPAWITDWVTGDHVSGGSSTAAAVAGYPSITVPAGFVHELPVGLTFFGTAWSEPVLIRMVYGFEQAARARKPPQFLKSVGAASTSE